MNALNAKNFILYNLPSDQGNWRVNPVRNSLVASLRRTYGRESREAYDQWLETEWGIISTVVNKEKGEKNESSSG